MSRVNSRLNDVVSGLVATNAFRGGENRVVYRLKRELRRGEQKLSAITLNVSRTADKKPTAEAS